MFTPVLQAQTQSTRSEKNTKTKATRKKRKKRRKKEKKHNTSSLPTSSALTTPEFNGLTLPHMPTTMGPTNNNSDSAPKQSLTSDPTSTVASNATKPTRPTRPRPTRPTKTKKRDQNNAPRRRRKNRTKQLARKVAPSVIGPMTTYINGKQQVYDQQSVTLSDLGRLGKDFPRLRFYQALQTDRHSRVVLLDDLMSAGENLTEKDREKYGNVVGSSVEVEEEVAVPVPEIQ
jgi:hypothetical protein